MTGICLVPVGEFSFVLGRAALDLNLVSPDLRQLLLGTSVVTMATAPWLVGGAPAIGQWVSHRLSRRRSPDDAAGVDLRDHVIILGFGLGGQMIARALRDVGMKYLVLELNGATVRDAARQGEPILYGDAANADALHAAGVDRARAVVATMSDPDATMRAVRTIRSLMPGLPIIVRTRYRVEADRLQRSGATLAVAEELEASLEVLAQLLTTLGIPGNVLQVLLDVFRRETTAGRPLTVPTVPLMAVPEAIQRAPVFTHQIAAGDWADGRTLGEVGLRHATGATVLAIVAGATTITAPMATQGLAAGQVLYLLGDETDIMLARQLLTRGPTG
jgi:CPA2 family monovalent cation:H+ antiporter-2